MKGGTFKNETGTSDTVANGTIYMTGGSVESPQSAAIRSGLSTDHMEITAGSLSGKYGIKFGNGSASGGYVLIGGTADIQGTDADIYLATDTDMFAIRDYFEGNVSVGVATLPAEGVKRQITHAGTSPEMLKHVTSAVEGYTIGYEDSHLYIWKHAHTWTFIKKNTEKNTSSGSSSHKKHHSGSASAETTAQAAESTPVQVAGAKTADTSHPLLWMMLLLASALALAVLTEKKKQY